MSIEIFEGHNVRLEIKDNKAWFNLSDVHAVLGAGKPADTVKRLKEGYVDTIDTPTTSGIQPMHYVSERGLIRVLHTSRSPLAEPFQDWADERVEQLMNGQTVNASGVVEDSEDAIILRAIKTLEARVEEQKKELEEARPKANVHDKVLDKKSALSFMKVLSTLQDDFPNLKRDDLKELMRKEGLIQKNSVDSTAKARTAGFAIDVATGDFNGRTRTQTRWTSVGINYLILKIEDGM